MTLSKVITAQEGVPTPQSGSPTTNVTWIDEKHPATITPTIARSALSRDPTDVTSATNHSIFTK